MGKPCTTNQSTFTDPSLAKGDIIKDYHLNELKDAINKEYKRRSNSNLDNLTVKVGGIVHRSDWLEVVNRIDALGSFKWSSGIKTDKLIKASHVEEARHNLNIEEAKCICDCNYCTCNCNYCTCDCNYCTCNCNYSCTCNCNYSCPCDCNYCTCNCNYCTCNCNYSNSDRRLKTEIRYF